MELRDIIWRLGKICSILGSPWFVVLTKRVGCMEPPFVSSHGRVSGIQNTRPERSESIRWFWRSGKPRILSSPRRSNIFRRIRKKTTFRPVLACFVQRAFAEFSYKDVMLEALFDRLCVRCETFKRPVAEAWHRDIYGAEKWNLRALPRTLPGGTKDILFGGWTNLDHREQKLVCLLSTHTETSSGSLGFSEFSDAEKKENRFNERLWNQRSRRYGYTLHTDDKGFVRVPPGHCVIFQQQLIHSVVSDLNQTPRHCEYSTA